MNYRAAVALMWGCCFFWVSVNPLSGAPEMPLSAQGLIGVQVFSSHLGATNWNSRPGDITASSNTLSTLEALTPSNRFYRVRVIQ